MTIYNTNIDIGELFIFSITYMKGETIMNISTVKNQSSSAYQMLYANKNANKKNKNSSVRKLTQSGDDAIIKNIKEMIEEKKKRLQEISADTNMSPKLKEMKMEMVQKQIEDLEKQLDQAMLEKQQREIEEMVKKEQEEKKEDSDTDKTKAERFTETFTDIASNFDSIHKHKILKAEKERDETRLKAEMENDASRGIHGIKFNETYDAKSAQAGLENSINKGYGKINNKIEEYSKQEEEQNKKTENEKSKEQKEEEELLEGKKYDDEEKQNMQTNTLIKSYENNSFENYMESGNTVNRSV